MKSAYLTKLLFNNKNLTSKLQLLSFKYPYSSLYKPATLQLCEDTDIIFSKKQSILLDKYDQLVKSNQIKYDAKQFEIVHNLNQFYQKILTYEPTKINKNKLQTALKEFFLKFQNEQSQKDKSFQVEVKSVYLYGGVGCGKTMLMDMIFSTIPENKPKLRIHFNKFMLNVHRNIHEIKNQEEFKNKDPLSVLSDELVEKFSLLFFDEFQVTDIADAMLMSRLFTALFERGMVVFFTSNRVPTDLYKNGLQRELFMPFIDRIYNTCQVMCLDSPIDYRKMANISSKRAYFNCDYENHLLDNLVKELSNDSMDKFTKTEIDVLGRKIQLDRTYNRILDTTFSFVCEEARSSVDYLEFCKLFDVIIMRDIPFIDMKTGDTLRRFITFIDALYDNHVRLICSGKASSPQFLFNLSRKISANGQSRLEEEYFAIDRTISRLIDMQSENYLQKTKSL